MDKELVLSMTQSEKTAVLELKDSMDSLIDTMLTSFGFEESEGADHRASVMHMASLMQESAAKLRPELLEDFNCIFDKITMAYFEPEKFYGFMHEYRDENDVLQLDNENLGEFYGRTMAVLSQVKVDFANRFSAL